MTKTDLVFVEFGTAHEDVFYSHFLILQKRFRLHIIANEKLIRHLPKSIEYASVTPIQVQDRPSLAVAWEARKKIKQIKPEYVCFSTAQGNVVRDLTLLMPRGIKLFGTHHNADKLLTSSSQKLIMLRLKKYLVLAKFIEENLRTKLKPDIKIKAFYPCFYEKIPGVPPVNFPGKLLVAVPGVIEQSRRDYFGLLEIMKKNPPSSKVHFLMLGNGSREDGPRFQEEVRKAGLERNFTFFNAYVSAEDMQTHLEASHLILPLLHPGIDYFQLYQDYKVTGSYDLAFGYNKPLLLHSAIGRNTDFTGFSLNYEVENLMKTLESLSPGDSKLQEISRRMAESENFKLDVVSRIYLDFILEA